MTTTDALPAARYKTVLVLMKSSEADATIAALEAGAADVDVADVDSYWKLSSPGDIRVDMAAVEQELGEPITLAKWLVVMSSYVGRIETGEDYLIVTANMPDFVPR
jgi:hypothetical protein